MPFPIDECTTESIEFRRRPSKRGKQCNSLEVNTNHKDVFRANSLEVDDRHKFDKIPVVRNVSSPTTLQYTKHRFVVQCNKHLMCVSSKKIFFLYFIIRLSFPKILHTGLQTLNFQQKILVLESF